MDVYMGNVNSFSMLTQAGQLFVIPFLHTVRCGRFLAEQ